MSGTFHTKSRSSKTDEWLSPPDIVNALGTFDLDPCVPADLPLSHRFAFLSYTKLQDGLSQDWHGRVWLNPPYSNVTDWMEKLSEHGNGIALVFARTDVKWFHDHVWPDARAILFIRKRPHFYYPDGTKAEGNSGGPVCLIAYGRDCADRLKESGIRGAFVDLYKGMGA